MGGGGWGGVGGGEDSFSLVFENSIVLIKCTLYDTVFQIQVSICRGVVFSYSFSIYCAAYHGIWCSVGLEKKKIHVYVVLGLLGLKKKKKIMSMCCRVRHQRPSGSRVRLPCAARPLPCCPALPLRRDQPLLPSALPPALPSVLPRHRRRGLTSWRSRP